MEKLNAETAQILNERFGKDTVMALATAEDGRPHVRYVNALYSDGCFYVVTHRLSGKMRQIRRSPAVAVCGDWFTAHGDGADLGAWSAPGNAALAARLRTAFAGWIGNGHSDLADGDTRILCIRLTTAFCSTTADGSTLISAPDTSPHRLARTPPFGYNNGHTAYRPHRGAYHGRGAP